MIRRSVSVFWGAFATIALLPSLVYGQVTISLSAPSSVQLGLGLTYGLTVTNTGAATASGLVVTDTLPAGLSATSLTTNCAGTTTVFCDIGTLASGQSASAAIEVVPLSAPVKLTNTASVTGGSSSTVSTNVISNGFALVLVMNSGDPTSLVVSNPAGLICSPFSVDPKHACGAFFAPGTVVTLTATAGANSTFVGWSGAGANGSAISCPGTGTCTVTMNQEYGVDANYKSPVGYPVSAEGDNGAVGVPFDTNFVRALVGGTPPYTYSLASGTLPAGLQLGNGHIYGTPAAVGTSAVTLKIQDSSTPTPSSVSVAVTITITNPPNTQPSLLNGQYALLFRGVTDPGTEETAMVGSLTFDGVGGVTGRININCNGDISVCAGAQSPPVSGTYSIGSDNRGAMNLNGMIFVIAAGDVGKDASGIASTVRIIRFDDIIGAIGTRGTGLLRRQDTSAFNASAFAGTYALGLTGQDPGRNQVVEASLFTMDASGNLSGGPWDVNDNGTLTTAGSFTGGTYSSVDPSTGRTILTFPVGVSAASAVAYVIDADNLFLMTLDSGATSYVTAGTAKRQMNPGMFANTSFSGPDVMTFEGHTGGASNEVSGVFMGTATASSGTFSITYDSNDALLLQLQATTNGAYSVASSGRGVLTLGGSEVVAYFTGQDEAFLMTASGGPAFGEIALQQGSPFAASSFAGNYIFNNFLPGAHQYSGAASAKACTFSATVDQSHGLPWLGYDNSAGFGFGVFPSGRVTTTFAQAPTLGTNDLFGYIVSPSRVLLAGVEDSKPTIIEVTPVSPAPPSLVSIAIAPSSSAIPTGQMQQYTLTGTYSNGSTQPLTAGVNWVSSNLGGATITSAGLASGVAAGTAQILASYGCLSSAPVTLTITPVLQSITVTTSSATLAAGQTDQFTATGHYSDGSTQNLTSSVAWSSSNTSIATISSSGLAAGVAAGGPINITASLNGISVMAQLTVIAGRVQVTKTLNGGAIPAGSSFTFQLRTGASATAAGTTLETETFTSSTPAGTILFTSLLIPGQQYEMCEQVMPGWLTTLGPPLYSVFNPSGDNSVVCTNFTPVAGQSSQVPFTINNQPPPGGMAMGIGFWKNWASCANSNGNQKPVLDMVLASFPIAANQTTHGVYIGDLYVNSCKMAVEILNKQSQNGTREASDLAYNLAAQLLATKLNVQAGAGSSACVATDINSANDLLNPVKDALGNTGVDFAAAFTNNTGAKMTSAQVNVANYLQAQLNAYNSNQGAQCPPAWVY